MIASQFFIRSLQALRRSFMASLMMFGFPLIFFFIFGVLVDSDFDLPDIEIAVDTSTVDASLVESLEALDGVEVSHHTFDDQLIPIELEAGGFGAYIHRENGFNKAFIDSARERTLSLVLKAAQIHAEDDLSAPSEVISIERIDVESAFVRYSIPGLFAMALLQLMVYATAMPILTERAAGTWRLFSTLPVSPLQILIGEGASRLIIASLQMLLLYGLTVTFVGITLSQNLLPFVIVSLVSAVMCITLGIAIGGGLPDERWGIHVLTSLSLFMLFLGNIFSPMHDVPGLRILVLANPITYSAEAFRWALTDTPGFLPPPLCLLVMIVWIIVGMLGVRLTFRYETVTTG